MAAARSSSKPTPKGVARTSPKQSSGRESRRFWLTYPTRLITRPVIWEMSRKFDVVFNVRQASVTDEIGIMCVELEAARPEIKAVISWLERQGVKVEPVEINVIES